ncbi:MAG TPA: B-4DMT family transporter [Pseudonocardiaceae bacterium]
MQSWLVRGLGMAAVHAVAQVVVAAGAVTGPDRMIRVVALVALAGVGVLWGATDGRREHPHAALVWFRAGLLAGPVAGLLGVLGRNLLVDGTGVEALPVALTGGAAFTALLVMGPAALGTALGRRWAVLRRGDSPAS